MRSGRGGGRRCRSHCPGGGSSAVKETVFCTGVNGAPSAKAPRFAQGFSPREPDLGYNPGGGVPQGSTGVFRQSEIQRGLTD
jgi:hypothetical protein